MSHFKHYLSQIVHVGPATWLKPYCTEQALQCIIICMTDTHVAKFSVKYRLGWYFRQHLDIATRINVFGLRKLIAIPRNQRMTDNGWIQGKMTTAVLNAYIFLALHFVQFKINVSGYLGSTVTSSSTLLKQSTIHIRLPSQEFIKRSTIRKASSSNSDVLFKAQILNLMLYSEIFCNIIANEA